jgi:hypothetical protein
MGNHGIFEIGANVFQMGNHGIVRWDVANTVSLEDSGSNERYTWNTTGIGFNGATPIARPNYTVTNVTPDRAYNADATSDAEIADVLGTLITDLISYGLLQ